jgi:hypothetical protein
MPILIGLKKQKDSAVADLTYKARQKKKSHERILILRLAIDEWAPERIATGGSGRALQPSSISMSSCTTPALAVAALSSAFPKKLLDPRAIETCFDNEFISLQTYGVCHLFEFNWNDKDNGLEYVDSQRICSTASPPCANKSSRTISAPYILPAKIPCRILLPHFQTEKDGIDTRQQFTRLERFGNVIICPDFQPTQFFALYGLGREKEEGDSAGQWVDR